MTDLNELLKDWKDNRLSYKEVNRAKHEALLDGIVDELEALKERAQVALEATVNDEGLAAVEAVIAQAKRGPGRPPKAEAA